MATSKRQHARGAFLRLQKIKKGSTSARIAARHNLRELRLTPNITPGLQDRNLILWGPGTSLEVQAHYREAIQAAGVTSMRKDAVRLLEAIVSLPVGSTGDLDNYFQAALNWMQDEFSAANIISAVVHLDEAAPHMHVLIVPLIEGRMRGADLFGKHAQVCARNVRFRQAMRQHLLALGIDVGDEHLLPAQECADAVLSELKRQRDPAMRSRVWPEIRDAIQRKPWPYYATLGLSLNQSPNTASKSALQASSRPHPFSQQGGRRMHAPARMRTMAEIFTKPQRKGLKDDDQRRPDRQSQPLARRFRQALPAKRVDCIDPTKLNTTLSAKHMDAPSIARQPSPPKHLKTGLMLALLPVTQTRRTLCSVGFARARLVTVMLKSWRLVTADANGSVTWQLNLIVLILWLLRWRPQWPRAP